MYFQIRELILWPKNNKFQPRRVPFELGKVNVISGSSQSGKSAIIPIIDYCLGSGLCSIPVGVIRDTCEWYGVLIQTSEGQKIFARRDPEKSKSTGDMFIVEDITIDLEKVIPVKTDDLNSVKRKLDVLAGLTNLSVGCIEDTNQLKGRPSFRDMAAFNFQPQGIVANPDTLLYKTNAYEHREKLKNIFSYILNAITPEVLLKQHELERLKKILQIKERELSSMKVVSERWQAELRSWAVRARELGLVTIPIELLPDQEGLVTILRAIVNNSSGEEATTSEILDEVIKEMSQIRNEESKASSELFRLRQRLDEMTNLKESVSKYYDALQSQQERLQISEWLRTMHDSNHVCPACGGKSELAVATIESLYISLKEIEANAANFQTPSAAFDREYQRVNADIKVVEEQLRALKIRRNALEKSSEVAKNNQYEATSKARFLGRLEQALEIFENIGTDSELSNHIVELREQIISLESGISDKEIERKRRWALDKISGYAGSLLPQLDIERPDDPIHFDITNLTVKVSGQDRDVYLWEIGSGANWLSYHVAITMALHRFFITVKNSPVPSFIVYDQPSQVYFPKRLATKEVESNEELDLQFNDEDADAVRKVFNAISSIVSVMNGNLQVIVLDHADASIWGEFEEVHLVEKKEWRNGYKLIPTEWIKDIRN